MVWQRNLSGSRRQSAGHNLTADGALRLAWAAWDRSLLPCLSAPELHAHLRGERAEGRKEQERERRAKCLSVMLMSMSWL